MPAIPASVGRARKIATGILRQAGRDDLDEAVVLVLSEILTNAVNAVAAAMMTPAPVAIALRCADPAAAHLRVSDPAPGRVPAPGRPRDHQECGRGLWIVHSVCPRWGVTLTEPGKCVWADIPSPAPQADSCQAATRPAWIPAPGELVTDYVSGLPALVTEFWQLSRCTVGVRLAEPEEQNLTWVRALTSLRPLTRP